MNRASFFRFSWLGVALIGLLYVAMLVALDALPYMDAPNHLARGLIISDLIFDDGAVFGGDFDFDLQLRAYMLGDLYLAFAVLLGGPRAAGVLYMLTAFAALPLGAAFYMRINRYPTIGVVAGTLCALYLAVDFFFLAGFASFKISLGLSLAALALADRVCERASPGRYALYVAVAAIAYLTHLASIAVLVVALGAVLSLRLYTRQVPLRTSAALMMPLAVVIAWHLVGPGGAEPAGGFVEWNSPVRKLLRVAAPFANFSPKVEFPLLGAMLSCLALAFFVSGRRLRPAHAEPLTISAALFAAYLAMPVATAEAYDIDARMLPLAWLFLVFAALRGLADERAVYRYLVPAAAAVAIAHMVHVWSSLRPHDAVLQSYRQIVAQLPIGANVLPISTLPDDGRVQPYIHAGSWATVDRAARQPFLFSLNSGHAMTYFSYKKALYRPDSFWYLRGRDGVEWDRVESTYDFILATKPIDVRRILLTVQTVAENDDAVLFRIVRPQTL